MPKANEPPSSPPPDDERPTLEIWIQTTKQKVIKDDEIVEQVVVTLIRPDNNEEVNFAFPNPKVF